MVRLARKAAQVVEAPAAIAVPVTSSMIPPNQACSDRRLEFCQHAEEDLKAVEGEHDPRHDPQEGVDGIGLRFQEASEHRQSSLSPQVAVTVPGADSRRISDSIASTALDTLPRQQDPCGFLTSHAQCPARTSAAIIAVTFVMPRVSISLRRSAAVMSKQ